MQIVDFLPEHIEDAARIAKAGYAAQRAHSPSLPAAVGWPDLVPYAKGGMGVAAVEDGRLVGFLCSVPPFSAAFRSTDATGAFSPVHANGALGENRAQIYLAMYCRAGELWARAGASSHAICLYANDCAAQRALFECGFGMRCIDGISMIGPSDAAEVPGYAFEELEEASWPEVLPLDHLLDAHMAASPTFILRPSAGAEEFMRAARGRGARFFGARCGGELVAFLRVERGGETFVCEDAGYLHIMGAYCQVDHRGTGAYAGLMGYARAALRREGCTRLGVDYESINPAAHRFWRKHFEPYTHSVVRRIDEHAILIENTP